MSSDGLAHLLVERPEPGLMVVRFNRPEVHNALNTATSEDLLKVFGKLAFTAGDLRCVILTASGEKAFSAGGDLKERKGMTDDAWRAQHAIIEEAAYSIINCSVPVIAAVNGVAAGAGLSFAACCDLAIAADTAKFTSAYTHIGLTPDGSSTFFLTRLLGRRRVMEMYMTNRVLSAQEALDWGLVNRVVPAADLMGEVTKLATQLANGPTRAYAGVKKLVMMSPNDTLESQMERETRVIAEMAGTKDAREGISAFVAKRKPTFTGE